MINIVKGFKDILPKEAAIRGDILLKAKRIFESNGFNEIILPILEKTELFTRSIGEATDIVQKEMYTFTDKNGDSLSLRPEGTASVVRAFVENNLFNKSTPHKYYYSGPMFRRERPQKGRLRQFYQLGLEFFGEDSPLADAHIIYILHKFLSEINLQNVVIEINSVGCEFCRPKYEEELTKYYTKNIDNLCEDCSSRLSKNPLRLLDCKNETCSQLKTDAPVIVEYLCSECLEHHNRLKDFLKIFNVNFRENKFMVRGLDYYTKTVFEAVSSDGLGSQNAVGAGGRYNNLVEQITGKKFHGIGFALGVERLVLLLNQDESEIAPDFFIVTLGESSLNIGIKIYLELTQKGFRGEFDYQLKGFKHQLKKADKYKSKFCIIIGENEVKSNKVIVKNMLTGVQQEIAAENIEGVLNEPYKL